MFYHCKQKLAETQRNRKTGEIQSIETGTDIKIN